MTEDPQRLVDDLALRIGRPVLLEDHGQRVISYSEQSGPVDDIRRDSILRRHTTSEVRALFRAAGIFESRGALRIPALPGALARVCVPLRHRDRLLGFLWLIDDSPPMSDEGVAIAAKSAPGLALMLFRDSLAAGLSFRRELEAVSQVLLGDHPSATAGAALLVEAGGFPGSEPVTAVVVAPVSSLDRAELEQGLLAARSRMTSRPLHFVRADHGVLLCPGRPPSDVHAAVGFPAVVGVGRPRASLAEAASSYREARHAAEVAARVPGYGPSASWSSLGVYRLLSTVPSAELHPGLERLLADPANRSLLETLETYLDLAGSVVATARALRLHRTSLYYRLQRVEELAGTDLKSGDERLALHLSLKLARLAGRF
ncbi:MAG: PucR family transcriptional regulator [Actinophytocola sp.]|uniref:PucR family transcriptional regulator n=1 Tax=Actinophytocola sp. TaxID=1872138 RepID=UPI001320706D|nr:helix-turn-helix domain-containing protein [Actinophytocola sp.]MPZ84642.1 PucR family transcriptional regulator [Actinophytocola sp.]